MTFLLYLVRSVLDKQQATLTPSASMNSIGLIQEFYIFMSCLLSFVNPLWHWIIIKALSGFLLPSYFYILFQLFYSIYIYSQQINWKNIFISFFYKKKILMILRKENLKRKAKKEIFWMFPFDWSWANILLLSNIFIH